MEFCLLDYLRWSEWFSWNYENFRGFEVQIILLHLCKIPGFLVEIVIDFTDVFLLTDNYLISNPIWKSFGTWGKSVDKIRFQEGSRKFRRS